MLKQIYGQIIGPILDRKGKNYALPIKSQYQTIHEVDRYGGLFDEQWATVVYTHMNEHGKDRVHLFDWQAETEATRQKLLPILQQTHDAFFDILPDYEYLFCAIGENIDDAVNMLYRKSDNQWCTVDEVINS